MPQPVASPEPAPLRIGLVTGARSPQDPVARWEQGIIYDPFHDHLGNEYPAVSLTEAGHITDVPSGLDPGTLEKTPPVGGDLNVWLPYWIWMAEQCSTFGLSLTEAQEEDFYTPRVRAGLEAQTSYRLEKSFSQGVLEVVEGESYTFAELGLPNRPLYSTDATELNGSAAVGPVPALELLVGAMADQMGGVRGMIHIPHVLLPYFDFYQQLNRNPSDGRFITLRSHDHTVIAGSGYDGLGPDGTDDTDSGIYWIYGTSPVEVRLGEVEPISRFEDAVNTRTNHVEYHAERLALASWDLSCHVAIPVAVADPGPEIGS